ncbi:MAG: hypothetical protein JXX29_14500 [Deltaproteobacteria bacterium]|nr:hypothetical protein [Deltaproteobacteria bacterium]MBN2672890.1 hypothetical protein [Deltaproteobacteria bacterium]
MKLSTELLRFVVWISLTGFAGCMPHASVPAAPSPAAMQQSNAFSDSLGDDALLISLPSDDNTLVGKVHIVTAANAAVTEVAFQANPCAQHLRIQRFPASRHIKDIRRFSSDINSAAIIKVVKIDGSISNVTDYQYEFDVTEKIVADDTIEYAECCAKARGACGAHFVRELYYGAGMYRLLQQTSASAGVGVPMIFSASGNKSFAILGEQSFRGYFAYKTKPTPAAPPPPAENRLATVSTTEVADMNLPATLEGAALVEQVGAQVVITTKSSAQSGSQQLKAIGEARQQQRRALKNLLAGPPYNTPPDQLNQRVESVYDAGQEVDAYRGNEGEWYLKISYPIQ